MKSLLQWIVPLLMAPAVHAQGLCFENNPPGLYNLGFSLHPSVATGDLDGDGHRDLVATSDSGDTAWVLLNLGNATFVTPVGYGVTGSPRSVALGDVDGDGDLDMAIGCDFSDRLAVLLNQGNGTFAPQVNYIVGDRPSSVGLADLDADGDLDAAVASLQDDNVSVLLNQGNGTFAPQVVYAAGSLCEDLEIADLDGDGDLDVAVASYFAAGVSILRNNGNGTFAPQTFAFTTSGGTSVAAGDLDGDGDQDLAVANWNTGSAGVLRNNGNATFAPLVHYAGGYRPISIGIDDLDGDGDRDLAMANYGDGNVSVYRNNGNGTFAPQLIYSGLSEPNNIAIDDLDMDGDRDLVLALGIDVAVLRNCGGVFPVMTPFCNPIFSGTIACPCNNNPTGAYRGCDNFGTFSGGASIAATGNPSLSADTIVLTCSGENLTPLNVLFQAKDPINPTGVIHSAGVRCVSSTLKRIYSGNAAGGNFVRPGMGDLSVSARSAALNDPIAPGESRHYFSIYRDNNAVIPCGGNPASNLNLTNAGTIVWGP